MRPSLKIRTKKSPPQTKRGKGSPYMDIQPRLSLSNKSLDLLLGRSCTLAADRQFAVSGKWALASDGLQWILQRKRSGRPPWRAVSFVRSTKDILARCMGENG